MGVYDRQIASAKRMIAAKGQAVNWLVRSEGTTNPAEAPGASKWRPKDTGSEPASFPVSIAFFPVTKEKYESLRGRGIELTEGAVMGYMAAVPFQPNQKDAVLRNGRVTPIETIDVIAPNGEAILYEIIFAAPVVLGAQNA